jgi:hypothetical protein
VRYSSPLTVGCTLSGVRAEFRTALRHEIEAARQVSAIDRPDLRGIPASPEVEGAMPGAQDLLVAGPLYPPERGSVVEDQLEVGCRSPQG